MAKINQVNSFSDYALQSEFENLYRALSQIEFSDTFTSGQRTTNILGYMLTVSAAASGEVSISHDLKRTPIGYMVVGRSASGDPYDGTTANDESTFYLRSTTNNVYKIILI